MNSPLALPFDQYQRYRLVSDLLETLRAPGQQLEVLDVGGRTALLRRFLPDRITLVDLEASEEPGLVLGDGARLPFRDQSFDVVTAFDTLEHVPPPLRKAFVGECRRVARRYVVLAGPYEAPRVVEAERLLQRFLREKLGVEHRYLEEHRHNGLPERVAVRKQLEGLGGRVASIGHGNLDRWLALMCISLYMDDDPALRPLAEAVHVFYNHSLYASDHAEPVYRHALVAAFEGAPLPDKGAILAPPVAPEGTLATFQELAGELMAFDRERGAWRVERERLRKVADDLRRDLEGHHGTLAEVQTELEAKSRLIDELHATLEDERAQAGGVRTELQGLADQNLEVARKLEAELRRVEGEARQMQADLQGLADQNLDVARKLEADLRRVEADALQIQAQLIAANATVARLGEQVEADAGIRAENESLSLERATLRQHLEVVQRESAALRQEHDALLGEVQALKATLRKRWHNLKRALGPRARTE